MSDITKWFIQLFHLVIDKLLDHRWLILPLFTLMALAFEFWEHANVDNPIDAHFVREVLFFGFILPIVIWWLLNNLLDLQAKHNSIVWQQNLERQVSKELAQAQDLTEIHDVLLSLPETIAPVVGVSLFQAQKNSALFEFIADKWAAEPKHPLRSTPATSQSLCGRSSHSNNDSLHPAFNSYPDNDSSLHHYCLPLSRGETLIGLLQLYLPPANPLTSEQTGLFNHIVPTIALALDSATSPDAEYLHGLAVRNERERIARYLHNTLGQSLAYLQLKVARLTSNEVLKQHTFVQHDLARMQAVTDEAFEQVRYTMQTLRMDNKQSLVEALTTMAKEAIPEADLAFNRSVKGEPKQLEASVERKILFVFKEALNNIQRHARATAVDLHINWGVQELEVYLRDNGIGFDPKAVTEKKHFGLLIMAQRAEEIGSHLELSSVPGKGTLVLLKYPIP